MTRYTGFNPWEYNFDYSINKYLLTYLVVQILKIEGYYLTLRYTSDWEVKPSFIVISFKVWSSILRDPDIKLMKNSKLFQMKITEYGPPVLERTTFDILPEQKALEKTI